MSSAPLEASASALGPIDPSSVRADEHDENEKAAPWIVRKLVGVSYVSHRLPTQQQTLILGDGWKSMTGRIVISSFESLRAAGTTVICLSPVRWTFPSSILCHETDLEGRGGNGTLQWGDSSPLLLPCIRFRDLAVHTIIVATV
jgi:hypothetical protein